MGLSADVWANPAANHRAYQGQNHYRPHSVQWPCCSSPSHSAASPSPVVLRLLFLFLQVIGHRHQYEMMRDTALYYPLRNLVDVRNEGVWPSLRKLAAAVLNEDMHAVGTAHDPVRFFIFIFYIYRFTARYYQEVTCLAIRATDIKAAF